MTAAHALAYSVREISIGVVIVKLSTVTTQGICRQAGTGGGAGNHGAGVPGNFLHLNAKSLPVAII